MNKFVKKYSGIAIVWLVALIAAVVFLPNMGTLEAEKGQTKIPSDMQSQVANNIEKHWGHHISNTDQVVLVYNNGNHAITKTQQTKINNKIKASTAQILIVFTHAAWSSPNIFTIGRVKVAATIFPIGDNPIRTTLSISLSPETLVIIAERLP